MDESGWKWMNFIHCAWKSYDLQHPTWQTANVKHLCILGDILQGTNAIVNENLNWVPSNVNRSFSSQVWIGSPLLPRLPPFPHSLFRTSSPARSVCVCARSCGCVWFASPSIWIVVSTNSIVFVPMSLLRVLLVDVIENRCIWIQKIGEDMEGRGCGKWWWLSQVPRILQLTDRRGNWRRRRRNIRGGGGGGGKRKTPYFGDKLGWVSSSPFWGFLPPFRGRMDIM